MTTETRKEQWRRARVKYYYRHKALENKRSRLYKMKLVEQRRCTSCSTPLLQDEKRVCVNCGGKTGREFAYAAHTKRLQHKNI